MGKGRLRRDASDSLPTRVGGIAHQRNALAAKNDASIIDQLRPGRHACKCQARKHELVMNCLGCGKIVCKQEGSGPCFFCGTLVCTAEEKEILDRGSKKSTELYEKLMGEVYKGERGISLFTLGRDLEKATEFRNKLLAADADSERRNKVNDLESDYSSVDRDPFLTQEERQRVRKRLEELQEIKEKRRKEMTISLNLSDLTVSEMREAHNNKPDPIIQEIIDRSEQRRKANEAVAETAFDVKWIPKGFIPKYTITSGKAFSSNAREFCEVENVAIMNDEFAILEVERKGYCIGLNQPIATLVSNGKIKHLRWEEDIQLKGPIFVSSFAKSTDMKCIENAVSKFCKESSAIGLDFTPGSIHGRIFVESCLTLCEYEQEYGKNINLAGSGKFVLIFSTCEPLRIPIPYMSQNKIFFQLDREMQKAMSDVFKL